MVERSFEDVERAELEGGDFAGVEWGDVDLDAARLERTTFAGAGLAGAEFTWTTCNAADFRAADLAGADFGSATVSGAAFDRADLSGASFEAAGADRARFVRATLARADLADCWLGRSELTDADLTDATLDGAYLSGAALTGATLRGADLAGASFREADLRDADLAGATLRGADLRDADLSGATLDGADLRDADLTGADVADGALAGADLDGATLPDGEELPADDRPPSARATLPVETDGLEAASWVGPAAVELLAENGYGPRESIEGYDYRQVLRAEWELGVTLPAAFRSFLRHCGRDAGGWIARNFQGNGLMLDRDAQRTARGVAEDWDAFTFRYADHHVAFLGHLSYTFWLFDVREGPDPPVYNHMENEGPRKLADSFSEWLFAEIDR